MNKKMIRVVALTAVALVAAMLPPTSASAAPAIKFLNPSDYRTPMLISGKADGNGDTSFHLVAWVSEVPSNAFVEFELSQSPIAPGGQDPGVVATINATRVGTAGDTFEGDLGFETVPADGQYFLRAILYSGFVGPGTGTEVARDQIPVTVQSSTQAAANTVEMAYPVNGGPLGFWRNGGNPGVAVFRGFASEGTAQARLLYTTSAPGTDPTWTHCGSGAVSQGQWVARCTLGKDDNPASVRAVAAVANQTPPPANASEGADQTGDAHRVVPYMQNPTGVTFQPSSIATDQSKCTAITAFVQDQFGQPVATLNVDAHAQGPDDQLRFATQVVNAIPQHSAFQAPDAAHTGNEQTARCQPTDPNGQQGDHNVPGGNDIKHIESTVATGTNNLGAFTMILISGTKGGTQVTVWGDENDDDSLNSGEAAGSAQIGWGEAPPPPKTSLNIDPSALTATIGQCQQMTVSATQNGTGQGGQNVDIHVTNPSGVSFCNPGGSGTTAPNGGGHVGDTDPDQENTHHAEGTTDANGNLTFGVTSSNSGTTSVVAWLDEDDSDTAGSNETSTAATIEWQEQGGRSISLQSSKRSVESGKRVTLSGSINGSNACEDNEVVKIQKKRSRGFRTITSTRTDGDGDYSIKVRVKKTTTYRALTPRNGSCEKATSNTVKVRAK